MWNPRKHKDRKKKKCRKSKIKKQKLIGKELLRIDKEVNLTIRKLPKRLFPKLMILLKKWAIKIFEKK